MIRFFAALAIGLPLAGCYDADVDPELEALYPCDGDGDCVEGQSCVLGLCTDGSTLLGPEPAVLGPEELQVFPAGMSVSLPIVIGGQGLELTPGGGANVIGEGSLDVMLDGVLVETLTVGSLEARVQTAPITIPSQPGLHRIQVISRQNDGSIYPTPGAVANNAFWVDDGREHIGFISPVPNTEVPIGEGSDLRMEVATLNFQLVNPGAVSANQLEAPFQGHVHVFFNRGVPDCLPGCNYSYESTVFPAGNATSRLVVEGGILGSPTEGTFPLELVAQDSAHEPYYRSDAATELVFSTIPLIFVAP